MSGSSLTSILAALAVVALVVLLVLELPLAGVGPVIQASEGLLALFVVVVGFRTASDVRRGRA
ncbi:MAG TPA: hypothetical protein VND92_01730 [Vicinamibacterales bacterium]|nr:hypothetical protein [Vicinamibacterales bacterium]